MSLVGRVGRKRLRARFAILLVYAILILGAVTTTFPFLLMVSTGMTGPTDQNENRLIPKFLSDSNSETTSTKIEPDSLLGKYLDDKYRGDASQIASSRIGHSASHEEITKYRKFLISLPLDQWVAGFMTAPNQVTGRLAMRYQAWLRGRYSSIDQLNRAYTEEHLAFQTVQPPNELLERKEWRPTPGPKFQDWLVFKEDLPAEFRIPLRSQRLFQEFLRSKFEGQIDRVDSKVKGDAKSFEGISMPNSGSLLDEFRTKGLPYAFKNGTVEDQWRTVAEGELPIHADEADFVREHASELKQEFATRNFRYVIDYVLLNGRALWNTAIFCILAIMTQLIVNPLAAYVLSRYPMPATGRILTFLLATMAFPAEVTMIPSFLLLKNLGLLNTFAALVLPAAASGYTIFLLKGFFDSLPQEVFESGQIDGAKELTMLARIALPLSKPVLGYIALLAFMGSYSAFMYAFLVAQNQKMWTLTVWIYQLQLGAPKAVMMAAVTIAAIPTLVVFLLAQRTIMRGIVLPGER